MACRWGCRSSPNRSTMAPFFIWGFSTRRPPDSTSVLVASRSSRFGHFFRLHAIDVELAGGRRHLLHHVVEIEAGRLREADRVDPRDDERAKVWADHAARLQL